MIESISISDIASYDTSGIRIDGIKKVNFIYGANATGKTTIARLLEDSNTPEFSNCRIKWQHDTPLQTLVYDKQFRERNFGKGKIDGIFTLGEATAGEKKAIELLVTQLAQIKDKGIKKKETLERLTEEKEGIKNSFRDEAWVDVYKKYEIAFKEAFTGVMRKEAFKDKLLAKYKSNKSELKTFEELKSKATTIFGEVPTYIGPINEIEYSRLLEIESDTIWEKKIIGKEDIEIARLIQHLNMDDWVNKGREYLQDSSICPFCQEETITISFRKRLDDYFGQVFKEHTQRVISLSAEYNLATQNLTNLLQEIESSEKANAKSKTDLNAFAAYNKTLAAQLNTNKEILRSKQKEPSRSLSLNSLKEQLDCIAELIANANSKIMAHNKIVENYVREKTHLIESIWKFLVEEHRTSIESFLRNISGKQKGIDSLSKQKDVLLGQFRELNKKIIIANKNVTSVQPSIDRINELLQFYGFLSFKIVPSSMDKNLYQIQREDGTIAEATLSEGEITFITFLYYFQRAKGGITEESISEERVLVIDDPVSSLDSSVLFIVSSLIKEILNSTKRNEGNIKQVILFTHNVFFHREVSYINGKPEKSNKTAFWILRKKNKVSTIQPYEMNNPIHNSYELLWRELENRNHNDGITIQNIMRRIIENYFKILGKYSFDDLIQNFSSFEEQEICRSMLCWVNDGSHGIPDDLYLEHPETTVDKYFDVFEKVFHKMGHHEHFKMMRGEAENQALAVNQ